MKKVLVTGANGQVGSELRFLSSALTGSTFMFTDHVELDITNAGAVSAFCQKEKFEVIINCAAYTAVDKAESEKEQAYKVNAEAAGILAKAASDIGARFIHFSTDFIFDGTATRPLLEDDKPNPLSVYGATKLEGEKLVIANNANAVIIRTSWVYSAYGNNFVKTILRLCREREELNVINDQVGTPTYARDLASVALDIAAHQAYMPGIYNYSNEGVISWYDFAVAIRDIAGLKTRINPIPTSQYPTPATRPKYSVLDKQKIKSTYGIEISDWQASLEQCMKLLSQ